MKDRKEEILKANHAKRIMNWENVFAQNPSIIESAYESMEQYADEKLGEFISNQKSFTYTEVVSKYILDQYAKERVICFDRWRIEMGWIKFTNDKYQPVYHGYNQKLKPVSYTTEQLYQQYPDWFKEITDTPPNPTKSVEVNGVKYLSPEEVLEREKKAFEAARKEKSNTYYCDIPQFIFRNKYPTFEDYKKDNL